MPRGFAALALAAMTLAACEGHAPIVRATAPDGSYSFELLADSHEEGDRDKHLWRLPDGLVVTAQRVPKSDGFVRDRHLDDVAAALATRYQLGEVGGAMHVVPCSLRGHAARCTTGTVRVEDHTYARRGVLFERTTDFVLLEVTGDEIRSTQVDAQVDLATRTYTDAPGHS